MPEMVVHGGHISYEFVGPQMGDVIVLTPGGRFGKDYGGVHALAEGLAAGGKRVLLWDRPNCGTSDIQLFGRTESHMRAEVLHGLLEKLHIDRVVAAGGSGGARDMIVFTLMYPEAVTRLATWSIVGGTFSTMCLAGVYVLDELRAVRMGGMEAVSKLPAWSELIANNPRNRHRLLGMDPGEFELVMERWLDAYVPKPNEVIPGVRDHEVAEIEVPTLIVRGGEKDFDHPMRTSYELHALIEGSVLVDPPWPEDAWERAVESTFAGTGSLFDPWPQAAPLLLDFIDARSVPVRTVAEPMRN
ncbi:hydrolase [Rhodococcus ruber BKS 20-38]|uniref:Hydrolase n=1 Tax=Rhodococcus ruber BKS 20-38 TaxID=1278076 RepID=M3A485_9NOCA|nr:alpha/beta hydrolase [Rhodococcus ruber]EME67289.1 hydrolase [Rhodococcus ruber BKS 20-38]